MRGRGSQYVVSLVATLSLQSSPSAEGSALALIDALIVSLDSHHRTAEPKAFRALRHDHHHPTTSQHSDTAATPNTVISADNINDLDIENIDEITAKSIEIMEALQSAKCRSWRMQIVPTDFYRRDLEYRAKHILSASSPNLLCKSLLMRNTKCIRDDCNDPRNSKFYVVVLQYTEKMLQRKLKKFVKSLANESNKYYNFSLASLEETYAMTRFEHNTVSPIGAGGIPVILSHRIPNLKHIWIGSGSLSITLRIDTADLLRFPHFVADVTA